jgi:ATP-dependent exoDNAse (exonuclease V) beta subunit
VIDLVYRAGSGWRIIDYKTDRTMADVQELAARYGGQVLRYRDAWTTVTGEPVDGAGLFGVRDLRTAWVAPPARP